jgi:antitoxin PrlF
MDASARLTSKGQLTIPKSVRSALALETGDTVHFRVEEGHAVVAKIPNFLDLAGTVPVPADKRGTSWDEIRKVTHREVGKRGR